MSGPVIVNNPDRGSNLGPILGLIALVIILVVVWLLFFNGGGAPGPGPVAS